MTITSGIWTKALNEAKKAPGKFQHGAVAFRGSEIIGFGYNRPTTLTKDYSRRVQLHAEIAAIKGLHHTMLRQIDVLVIRVTSTGKLTNSKPCDKCVPILRRKGIQRVYYTNEFGKICLFHI